MKLVAGLFIGYLCGSFPAAYLVGKWIGQMDLREKGSGNLGTTNVIRNLGLGPGILAYIIDMLKALLPTLLLRNLWGFEVAILTGIGAMIGHCYSIFFNFQGGKGIAVASGVLIVLDPVIAAILISGQLLIFFATRYMGLASIISAAAFPILTYFLRGVGSLFYASLVMSPFVIFQHRSNLKRLLSGTENKL